MTESISNTTPDHFLQTQIKKDLAEGFAEPIVTRFPPEPNGYLHIGHAKSICLNFGIAEQFGGYCNLRFDDTNPAKEDIEFVDAIKADIKWLGFSWNEEVKYTSNYFQKLYEWGLELIDKELAYVCQLSPTEAREYRGTLTEAGTDSPHRNQTIAENHQLFDDMKQGKLEAGQAVLRAKIDMANPNMNMRDPILFRIIHAEHHQTGSDWCIYPSYDFAHGQGDAIEHVSHSICTLEFADHQPLYNWFIANLSVPSKPRQFEFARLQLSYTLTSKRKLKQLVDDNSVDGWTDPRMPTLSGLRRRGIRPVAIRQFCESVGLTRSNSTVDIAQFDYFVRDDLDKNAGRAMCVINPIKLVLTNYPEDKVEYLTAPGHPVRDDFAERKLPFSKELYIDAEDYREEANKKYKRLVKGKRVRLRNAYIIEADESVSDDAGYVTTIYARLIDNTLGCDPEDGIKAKGVIHWVSAVENAPCKVALYEPLITVADPQKHLQNDDSLEAIINPESLTMANNAFAEIGLLDAPLNTTWQFEREGYFCRDSESGEQLLFNKTIGLRDTWNKS